MKNTDTTFKTDTQSLFNIILHSNLFRLDGGPIDLLSTLHALCDAINEESGKEENQDGGGIWQLGEFLDVDLAGLIIGAFWSLTQWHAGQYSREYSVLCSLGSIFSPGMEAGPEPDTGEEYAFQQFNKYFENKNNKKKS